MPQHVIEQANHSGHLLSDRHVYIFSVSHCTLKTRTLRTFSRIHLMKAPDLIECWGRARDCCTAWAGVRGALNADGKSEVDHHTGHVFSQRQVSAVEVPVANAGLLATCSGHKKA